MKKPQIITEPVKITAIVPGGQALGVLASGQKVFLWGALTGEIVENFLVTKRKSHYLEGVAQTISNPASFRIAPKDECYLSTSPWQIMDYDFELTTKAEIVAELARQHQVSCPNIKQPITDGKIFHYRNKMEYSLYYDHDTAKIYPSFRLRGSHRKIPIKNSSLEIPAIFQTAQQIVNKLNQSQHKASDFQALLLRANQQGEVSGGLLENYQPHPSFTPLKDTILGQEYTYSPNGFFQINLPVYEMALQFIQQHISTRKVLDLYSGVGSIGLSVAKDCTLTLVEVNAAAYQELVSNCQAVSQQSSNSIIKPVLAKSEEVLEFIAPDSTVIMDPPRAGCDVKLLEKINEVQPLRVIYMSCNPATLMRDLKILSLAYRISDLKLFNFFPRTPHIEAVAILDKIA